ncbi:hypothetical protein GCM10010324_04060 [Streptomyces hiroshimensis]|uniref:Uncharacterized protein n=1 Tax=Streptomyces hiroshimensis TaxID=66424 RepID=A0ABQ2Y3R8_9ACTN|nr:hypothetical protein GCM10010324_04060 [Streptomyces hiroshimensis]
MVRANTEDADPDPVIALREASGSFLVCTPGMLWWAETSAEEGRLASHQRFRGTDGKSWTWGHEVIRDVDVEGRPYSWEAWVCVTEATPTLWTRPTRPARPNSAARHGPETAKFGGPVVRRHQACAVPSVCSRSLTTPATAQ